MSDLVGKKLYLASYNGLASEVSSLLRDHPEINVNWADSDKWTALHVAAFSGHVHIAKLLLAHPDIDVNVKNRFEQTSFLRGCQTGVVSVVQVLLKDPRVDVTLDDNNGCTPLWWASRCGKHEVVEWLIASGRYLGDIKNTKGKLFGEEYTALEIARQQGKSEVVTLLERFLDNPAQTRQQLRLKLNVNGI